MGYAEIACCKNCEIPVETTSPDGFQHTCHRCNNLWLNDDLLFLDWQTANLNARVIEEFDRTKTLTDATLDLINEIKRVTKETTNE
jgi:hypothetical protein